MLNVDIFLAYCL